MIAFASTLRRPRAVLPIAAAAAALLALPAPSSAGVALSTSGWEWSDPSPQGYTLNDLQFAGQRGFAVGAGGTALRTDDGGATWSGLFTGTSTNGNLVDVISPDAFAMSTGSDGNCSIRLTTDGGATFRQLPVAENDFTCAGDQFVSFDFVSTTTGYVLRSGGAVNSTSNGGETFSSRSVVDGGTSLRFASDQVGFATSGNGKIYKTTDGAQTWAPIHDAGGPLSQIRLIDASNIIAWGKDRLVRSTDGGATFTAGSIAGNPSRMSWSDADHLAFVSDAKLLLSDDGGVTIREVTLGNKDVIAAGFVDANRLVAVGVGGVTYLSTDAGANFSRLSTDRVADTLDRIDESSGGGPVGIGKAGTIARLDGGRWVPRATLSASPVVDADFSSAQRGYVLQSGNVLRQTTDNGASWKTISAGAPSSVEFIATPTDDTVLLFGGFGVLRATGGGAFDKVTDKLVAKLKPSGARALGQRVIAWPGTGKDKAVVSSDAGKAWKKVSLPKGVKRAGDLRLLPGKGLLLVSGGRLFRSSSDTGKKWSEISSLGGHAFDRPVGVTVASSTEYYAATSLSDWPSPVVLHTTDSGRTWQPQAVGAAGTDVTSLVSGSPKTAYALSKATIGSGPAPSIFATTTGGSRGTETRLSLERTKSKLRRSAGKIQVTGQLTGGLGGETVHVAIRKEGTGKWIGQNVTVGANGGGSFTAQLKAGKGKYVVVAQWAGDSGRAGTGTSAKSLTITK